MPLRLEKRKSSGIWRIRGSHYGVSIDQSARTRSKTEAGTILKSLEKQIFIQVHDLEKSGQTYTFADAVIRWIEAGGETKPFPYFETVLSHMAEFDLATLTQGQIDKTALEAFPTQSAATRKRHFYTPVSVILNFAAGERMMSFMKLKRPSVKETRPDYITPDKAETLIEAAGDLGPLLTFFLGTGGRTSEIMRAEWDDVSPDAYRITFWDTKGERPRSVDLCDRTRAALPVRRTGRIWRTRSGKPWAEINERFHGPATRLARLSERLGWDRLGLHALRHSWASWQYAIEPDPLKLMVKGGWSEQKMVTRYVHLGTPDLAKDVHRFGWFKYRNTGNIRAIKSA